MNKEKFDLVVIGSGPGGEKGAAQAAYFGKSVALIEKEKALGGAAANTGTLPSKTLRETSLYLSGFDRRQLSGLTLTRDTDVTVGTFLTHERSIKDIERQRIENNLERHKVKTIYGTASFIDANTIEVSARGNNEKKVIEADVFLVATGSYPRRLPNIPYTDPRIYDSDTILDLHHIPKKMFVIGGGVIGCEYACIFSELGAEVWLLEGRDRLLGFLDKELSVELQQQMTDNKINVILNDSFDTVVALEKPDRLQVSTTSGLKKEVDTVLVSAGRCSAIDDLNLENAGVEVMERGRINVDDTYRTNIDNIYAVGDVIGFPALASTSMEQGRVAMVHAFNLKYKTEVAQILPFGVYTIPECSMAGATEEELQKEGIPYAVGRATYKSNARGQIIGDKNGLIKLVFSVSDDPKKDMKLLGVHILGEMATELVHIGLTALLTQADVNLFINTCYNYPTISEIYKYAAYDALGTRTTMNNKDHQAATA